MTLKCITAKIEIKYLHAQFREAHTSYVDHVKLGISILSHSLFYHRLSRVKWDRSDEFLMLEANLAKDFAGIGGHVIGIIDVLKLESLRPSDSSRCNCDRNRWHSTVNIHLVMV